MLQGQGIFEGISARLQKSDPIFAFSRNFLYPAAIFLPSFVSSFSRGKWMARQFTAHIFSMKEHSP
jgi:hypothetical protein